jgi:hypothetical protein
MSGCCPSSSSLRRPIRRGRLDRVAGANRISCLVGDEEGALPIGQTSKVSRLAERGRRTHLYRPAKAKGFYAFVLEGEAEIADAILTRRDSIALEGEEAFVVPATLARGNSRCAPFGCGCSLPPELRRSSACGSGQAGV